MRTYLFIVFVIASIDLSFAQSDKNNYNKPLIETKVAPKGEFWASMKVYKDYSTISFQDYDYLLKPKVESFSLSNQDMNRLFELLINSKASINEEYKLETMDGMSYLVLTYTKNYQRSYPLLYLYKSQYDNNGCRMPPLTNIQFRELFNKK